MENKISDPQIKEMMERIGEILESHPAVVYLPCYYRDEPPRIFLTRDSARVMSRGPKSPDYGMEYFDLAGRGYREVEEGTYYFAYEFLPGRFFEMEFTSVMLEKELSGEGGLVEEVTALRDCLGIYDLVPMLDMRKLEEDAEGAPVTLRIRKLDPTIDVPAYAHPGDAGLDICSAEDVTLEPGERAMVSTGFSMALPEGYAAFVQPRSGLAARDGISIVNTPGLIDCHYRGEVKVILINLGRETFRVNKGDRIAQMVIQKVENARVVVVDELDDTTRGEGGFGSTGM
jgi:dUTP pyrophosphatase